jgi:hypothetical protein
VSVPFIGTSMLLLELECPTNAHVLNDWSLGWNYWEMVETLGLFRRLATNQKSVGQ